MKFHEKLKDTINKIEEQKQVISKSRNRLEKLYEEIKELSESIECAEIDLNEAKCSLQNAIDNVSQFV